MAERKKLAIIDGKSVFYRGYYAMPNLSTKEGVPTGGVFGFASMALELLRKLEPDYVAVAWDKPKTNIRKRLEMYPAYKAGRKPAPPDFYTQIPILHELLEAFHWPLYELDDYEADDIMGTLAVQAHKKDIETLLITSDLDALQLINDKVRVYALKKGFSNIEEFHLDSFEAKYGLKADQFLDLKALKGDSSDNIPGVPGIGEKTAVQLLQEFKTLDNIYKNLDLIKDSVRKKLENGKDSAYLSKKIGAIWCDAPMKLDLPAMDGSKIDAEHLAKLLQKLEFRSLLARLPEQYRVSGQISDLRSQISDLKLPKNILIDDDKKLSQVKLNTKNSIFIHSRAAGAHGADPQALILGDDKQIYTLDLTKLNLKDLRSQISDLSKAGVVGYDLKSIFKLLIRLGLDCPTAEHDVLVAAYLLNSLRRAQSLSDLAAEELDYHNDSLDDMPVEDYITRSAEMMAVITKLYEIQVKELAKVPKVNKLARDIEWPLTEVLAHMELDGIELDTAYLKKFSKKLEGQISDVEQKIYGHADHEFNIGSPGQLADVLFTKLNLPTQGIKRGKTGFSTAATELDKLRGQHPIIDLISQYREMAKLKNTYVDVLPKMVDEHSRLHTTFNLTIAPTGRLSSADPNLQAIPVRTELGRNIRTAFVAGKSNLLVSADYSQFEIRLAAALSGDQGMIDSFNHDRDSHTETAALVLGIKPEDVTKDQRFSAKAVNFGIMYGQGPHGLSASSGLDFGAARDFIAKYWEIRPALKKFVDDTKKQAEEQGYVETLLGRRRPTPDVRSSNFMVREGAYRAAINHPIQGTAADLTKMAMIKIQHELDQNSEFRIQNKGGKDRIPHSPFSILSAKPKQLLQIHDSILIEVPAGKAKAAGATMKQIMENIYKLPVKLKVDISTGKNWGEL